MYKSLQNISECIRNQLYACESIKSQIDRLKVKSKLESKLKIQLNEMIKTVIVDLLIYTDFINEVLLSAYDEDGSLNEAELETQLQVANENFNEVIN